MGDRFQELQVFVRVVETKSFSAAARELHLSQPSASRIVSELEARLGVKLLLRDTRHLSTTDAGTSFLVRAKQLLHDLGEADDAARGVDSLKGTLRVALPVTLGIRVIIPLLLPFMEEHPELDLDLLPSDGYQDLILEGADVALRTGKLEDSEFGARRLSTIGRCVVAAPSYLERRGTPLTLADLASHDCIFGPGGSARNSWSFARDGAAHSVDVSGRLQIASLEGVLASARAGLGIAVVSEWVGREDMELGRLVRVLSDYSLTPLPLNAIFPAGRQPSQKVRAFVSYLSRALPHE